jgi:hypothetical protein
MKQYPCGLLGFEVIAMVDPCLADRPRVLLGVVRDIFIFRVFEDICDLCDGALVVRRLAA